MANDGKEEKGCASMIAAVGLSLAMVGSVIVYHKKSNAEIESNERIAYIKQGMTPMPQLTDQLGTHEKYLKSCEEIAKSNTSINSSKVYTGNIIGNDIADKFTIVKDANGNSLLGLIEVDGKPVLDEKSITYLLKQKED